jgi:hypothetical protein
MHYFSKYIGVILFFHPFILSSIYFVIHSFFRAQHPIQLDPTIVVVSVSLQR